VLRIIGDSATGKDYPPEFPELSDMWSDMILPALQFAAVTIISWAPAVIWTILLIVRGGIFALATPTFLIGFVICAIFALIYYPMVLAILGIWNSLAPALNPALIFRLIGRILKEYIIFLVFWYGAWFIKLLMYIVASMTMPMGASIVGVIIECYLFIVLLHMLGRMCYQTESKLAWQ
jgi:hypothetical protein